MIITTEFEKVYEKYNNMLPIRKKAYDMWTSAVSEKEISTSKIYRKFTKKDWKETGEIFKDKIFETIPLKHPDIISLLNQNIDSQKLREIELQKVMLYATTFLQHVHPFDITKKKSYRKFIQLNIQKIKTLQKNLDNNVLCLMSRHILSLLHNAQTDPLILTKYRPEHNKIEERARKKLQEHYKVIKND